MGSGDLALTEWCSSRRFDRVRRRHTADGEKPILARSAPAPCDLGFSDLAGLAYTCTVVGWCPRNPSWLHLYCSRLVS